MLLQTIVTCLYYYCTVTVFDIKPLHPDTGAAVGDLTPLSDSSLTHSNLAAVLETVEVGQLGDCFIVPGSVRGKLRQQCDNDEERRNELISWWLQYSPYALDSWKWLSGQLLFWEEESALAAAKIYIHQTPGMSVINYRHAHIHVHSVVYNQCCVIMVRGHHKPSPY